MNQLRLDRFKFAVNLSYISILHVEHVKAITEYFIDAVKYAPIIP